MVKCHYCKRLIQDNTDICEHCGKKQDWRLLPYEFENKVFKYEHDNAVKLFEEAVLTAKDFQANMTAAYGRMQEVGNNMVVLAEIIATAQMTSSSQNAAITHLNNANAIMQKDMLLRSEMLARKNNMVIEKMFEATEKNNKTADKILKATGDNNATADKMLLATRYMLAVAALTFIVAVFTLIVGMKTSNAPSSDNVKTKGYSRPGIVNIKPHNENIQNAKRNPPPQIAPHD